MLLLTFCFLLPRVIFAQSATLGGGTKGTGSVLYLNFDESGGSTVYDQSGNANNGTLNAGGGGSNTAAGHMWSRQGKIGGAGEFDGTDDYVDLGDYDDRPTLQLDAGNWSIFAWIKPNTHSLESCVYGIRTGSDQDFRIGIDGNNKAYITWVSYPSHPAYSKTTGSASLNDGNWHYIGAKREGGTITLYVDGVVAGTDATVGTYDITGPGWFSRWSIGAYREGCCTTWEAGYWKAFFNGLIDEVKVYNYARTADQILVDYNAGSAAHLGAGTDPNEGNPSIVYYNFDENTGTTVYDRSGNNNNATFSGSPSWTAGKYGSCLKFPTDDSYVYAPPSSTINLGTSDFSVVGWVNIPKPVTYGSGIFGRYAHNTDYNGCFCVGISDNLTSLFFHHRNTSGTIESYSIDYSAYFSKWIHMAWVKSGTKLYLYLNGELKQTWTPTISFNVTFASWIYMISNTGWSPGTMTDLMVDEHKIYNYARTPTQIAWDYNKGKPVGHWNMDEATSGSAHNQTIYDASGKGNNGTANYGANATGMTWTTGKFGGALSFDGVDDYVDCGNNSSLVFGTSNFTIGLWMKAKGTSTYNAVFDKGSPSDATKPGYQLFLSGGSLRYNISDGVGNWTELVVGGSPDMRDDTWHHVAWVYNGSNNKFYLDGRLLDTDAWTYGSGSPTANFYIGKSWVTGFNGLIDDVRIYNYARTADQVKQDYNEGSAVHLGN